MRLVQPFLFNLFSTNRVFEYAESLNFSLEFKALYLSFEFFTSVFRITLPSYVNLGCFLLFSLSYCVLRFEFFGL